MKFLIFLASFCYSLGSVSLVGSMGLKSVIIRCEDDMEFNFKFINFKVVQILINSYEAILDK